ncbi:hypothetical protein ABW19_dt0202780 [Dactylella cylindrospora]|nr:hypothetical protein ABW19_dt0202780 [Dactylella cylindrospora]
MATPPLSSSPALATRVGLRQHDAVPPSSPPPFLSRRKSLKRSASSSSSIDPESPSSRPAKRRAVRGGLRRANSMSQPETGNENILPSTPQSRPGLKRTPSLLPAIDFQSSPPRPTRTEPEKLPLEPICDLPLDQLKKKTTNHYPTPAPTSELGIPTSSPPRAAAPSRSGLRRTNSAISELRAPLASVPTVTLPKDPTPVTFGRSANKCTYLLSKSHLVSRIHFKACFLGLGLRKQVEVHCIGFNGAKVHCKGEIWELRYGDKFWSESGADIMLEIDDARVVLRWPSDSLSPTSPLSPAIRPVVLDAETFPFPPEYVESKDTRKRQWPTEGVDKFLGFTGDPVPTLNKPSARHGSICSAALAEPAPLRLSREPWSVAPESPCPLPKHNRLIAQSPINPFASMTSQATFTLYEDEDDAANVITEPLVEEVEDHGSVLRESQQPESRNTEVEYDDDEDDEEDDEIEFDDEDCENSQDPATVVHSHSENHNTSLSPGEKTPKKTYKIPKLDESVKKDPLSPKSKQSIMKHLINQLAFSRLASTPLSNLYKSLPTAVMDKVSVDFVQALLSNVACIGEIKREGKDASGKPLECEYYYIADMDDDEDRKAIVNSVNKPSLRACRKVHKQYFWKKPKV